MGVAHLLSKEWHPLLHATCEIITLFFRQLFQTYLKAFLTMAAVAAELKGEWVWETCTLNVSSTEDSACVIQARGELGWRVEVSYNMSEDGSLQRKSVKAVGQPLQDGESLPTDENMSVIRKLLMKLHTMALEESDLRLSTDDGDQVIKFTKAKKA